MRILIYLTLFWVCVKHVACSFFTAENKDRHPNILMIIVDDLRPFFRVYGEEIAITPNIDKLARAGVIFKNVFAQQALCSPSRTSFLTSRRPDSIKIFDNHTYWRMCTGNFTSLPQYFKENKYYTKSIGKVFHPGPASNYSDDYPLSWSEEASHPSTECFENAYVCPNPKGLWWSENLICPVKVKDQVQNTLPDIQIKAEAIRFLKKRRYKDEPFFLAVGFHKPHIPFRTPKKYFREYPIENITLPVFRTYSPTLPPVAWNPWIDIRKRDDMEKLDIPFPFGPIPDDWVKKIIQGYYASVTYIDDMIGKILTRLKDFKLHEKTIVILLGDHGFSLGEHGEWGKYSNFEVALKVPLIMRIPNVTYFPNTDEEEKGVTINDMVELVDLFPTVAELAGLEKLKKCPKGKSANTTLCTEGRSLAPLIREKIYKNESAEKDEEKVFSQYPRPSIVPTEDPDSDQPKMKEILFMGFSIRTKRYRYTEWIPFNPKTQRANWEIVIAGEFYDHLVDDGENINLFGLSELNEIQKQLSNQLKEQFKREYNEL